MRDAINRVCTGGHNLSGDEQHKVLFAPDIISIVDMTGAKGCKKVHLAPGEGDGLFIVNGQLTMNGKQILKKGMMEGIFNTTQLPEGIYQNLPGILRESAELFEENIEKDVFLIGSLAVISGCLPNIQGVYFKEPYSPHLYVFITAPAGAGKGKMKWAGYFGQAIHEYLTDLTKSARKEYEREMENFYSMPLAMRLGKEKPCEPRHRMFFIPANSSSSAFIQALSENDFTGVLFETEADTLANTFKQEWGNFSDVLRKAFHHESATLFRRKDNEFIDVRNPHLAIVLSGTPRQVQHIMPDAENGLFSRFLYYAFEDDGPFKNPFISHKDIDYLQFFEGQGKRIFELYRKLSLLQKPVVFSFSSEQADHFTGIFDKMLQKSKLLLGNDLEANIKRLGLATFRIAMIFSALRLMGERKIPESIVCDETDFRTALSITFTLEKHALAVYNNLPNKLRGTKMTFYNALPEEFNRKTYLSVAANLGIRERNADKYIGIFEKSLLKHERTEYRKINCE